MKFVKISDSPRGIILSEERIPKPKECDIVVKLKACGICGSDLGNIFYNSCKPSKRLGHELAGTIVNMGNRVKDFKIGDNVLVHHHCPCEKCQICLKGSQTMCEKFDYAIEPCGMADQFLVDEWIVKHGGIFKIPKWMSFDEAALIEPLACCFRAWKKLNRRQIESLVIYGVGPIGVMHAMLAHHFGITKIFCIDVDKFRLEFCKENDIAIPLNLDINNHKKTRNVMPSITPELIIIATSDVNVINNAIDIVGNGGIILLFGEPPAICKVRIDFSKIYSKEIVLLTSYSASNMEIAESIKLVEKNPINLKLLITHRFPLSDISHALDILQNKKNVMKIILTESLQ